MTPVDGKRVAVRGAALHDAIVNAGELRGGHRQNRSAEHVDGDDVERVTAPGGDVMEHRPCEIRQRCARVVPLVPTGERMLDRRLDNRGPEDCRVRVVVEEQPLGQGLGVRVCVREAQGLSALASPVDAFGLLGQGLTGTGDALQFGVDLETVSVGCSLRIARLGDESVVFASDEARTDVDQPSGPTASATSAACSAPRTLARTARSTSGSKSTKPAQWITRSTSAISRRPARSIPMHGLDTSPSMGMRHRIRSRCSSRGSACNGMRAGE